VAAAHKVIALQTASEGRGDHHLGEPKLFGEVKFTEWTAGGEMRHPAFLGLREDKKAKDLGGGGGLRHTAGVLSPGARR
jgi:ATP-dependent DNA ligase